MRKILIVDNSPRDAERYATAFKGIDDLQAVVCASGDEAEAALSAGPQDVAAIIILLEIPGPPFAFELLLRCRQVLPDRPLVVVSSALDASLATRAFALGARDFLEKPLDLERVRRCVLSLLYTQDPDLPIVERLRESILGDSATLQATLKQVAKVIPHPQTRVLLVGESGTGKELLAQGIHRLGPRADEPCVAVNVGAIPHELMESQLFGHEKGAFTSAVDAHRGYLEEAGLGTVFLDEIGELDVSLQVKLLRVIQERKFRRLKGSKDLEFNARLICATNRDLARSVQDNTFRRDLFHRIAEVTIHVPPLRERKGDVDLLLEHFLKTMNARRPVHFARETLTILRSYPFPGNVRELENLVSAALIDCDGEWVLPQHLPLQSMGVFLAAENHAAPVAEAGAGRGPNGGPGPPDRPPESPEQPLERLFHELARALPPNWLEMPYKEMLELCLRGFDRAYLTRLIERYHHNVTKATRAAGMDKKTLDRHWKEAGLPPLRAEEDRADD